MNNQEDTNIQQHTPEFMKAFGQRLRALRKSKGLTINDTIKLLQVPRSTYASWEIGKRIPKSKPLKSLAKLFETHESYLMLTSDDLKSPSNDIKEMLEIKGVKFDDYVLTDKEIELTNLFLKSLIENKKSVVESK